MKKFILNTKGYFENGQFHVTHVKVTKDVVSHERNVNLKLSTGFLAKTSSCEPKCPADTLEGFYMCVGGNCVFFPNP